MSTCVWKGGAPAVAKVITCTIGGTIETDDIFKATIGGKTLSVTAGSATAGTVATTFAAAWNALSATTYPEFSEITAAATSGGALTLTSDTGGVDFSVTLSTTEANGSAADDQTFTQSTTIANAGPNDWSTASNWSGGAVPVNSDDVVLENSDTPVYYGLDQSAVTLASLTVKQSFVDSGAVGLPRTNANGYVEYRDTYLRIGATKIDIGGGSGLGSGRIKIDTGSVQTTLNVSNSGSSLEDGIPAILWKGTHASNAVSVTKGDVGVAVFAGETATVATLKLGYVSSLETDANVVCGSGVTLGTVTKNGGHLECDTTTAAITALTQTDGDTIVFGSTNAVTSLVAYGGQVYYNTSGTLTAAVVGGSATLDFRQDMRAKTVTACQRYAGSIIYDPAAVVTWTNGIDYLGCGLENTTSELGTHRTWTPSAI